MNVLLYSTTKGRIEREVEGLVEALVPREKLEICRTADDLYNRLCAPVDDLGAAVLLACDRKDLSDMLSMKELIWRLRAILILPDMEADSISKAYALQPRFVGYVDSNLLVVSAMLNKMLENT